MSAAVRGATIRRFEQAVDSPGPESFFFTLGITHGRNNSHLTCNGS
jgi:hypothetical protein